MKQVQTQPLIAPWPVRRETPAEEAVRRGMRVLDEKAPGWERKIDLGTLALADPKACVLCQVFGEYLGGLEKSGTVSDAGASHGFHWDDAYTYDDLDAAWTEAIRARRADLPYEGER